MDAKLEQKHLKRCRVAYGLENKGDVEFTVSKKKNSQKTDKHMNAIPT